MDNLGFTLSPHSVLLILFIVIGVRTSNPKSLSVLSAAQHIVEQCTVPLAISITKTLILGTLMPNCIKLNSIESNKLMSGNAKHTTMTVMMSLSGSETHMSRQTKLNPVKVHRQGLLLLIAIRYGRNKGQFHVHLCLQGKHASRKTLVLYVMLLCSQTANSLYCFRKEQEKE